MEFSSVALRLGLRFLDCVRCALVFGACGSFRIPGSQPCPRIAGHGRCRQIWRRRRGRSPSGASQWLGKPLRSGRPWSSGAPSSHHEKEYHSVAWCCADSSRMVGHSESIAGTASGRGNRLCRRRYSLLSVATNGSPAFALRSWSLISPRLEAADDALDHREDELNVEIG